MPALNEDLVSDADGSRRCLAALFDSTTVVAVLLEPDGNIVRLNEAGKRMFGYSSEECRGRAIWDVLPSAEGVRDIKAMFGAARTSDSPKVCEQTWVSRDGRLRRVTWSAVVLLDECGNAEYVLGIGVEVPRDQSVDDALRESEHSYREFYENSRDGYALADIQGRIIQSNSTFQRMVGYTSEELRHRTYADLTPAKWRDAEERIVEDAPPVAGTAVGPESSPVMTSAVAGPEVSVAPAPPTSSMVSAPLGPSQPLGSGQVVQPFSGEVRTSSAPSPAEGPSTGSVPQSRGATVSPVAVTPVAADAVAPAIPAPDASRAVRDPLAEAGDVVWYIRPASGGQFGPAGNEMMRVWIGEGRVAGDSLVWREGWRDWQEAADIFPQLKVAPVDHPTGQFPVATSPAAVARSSRGSLRRRSSATQAAAVILLIFAVMILFVVFLWVLFRDPAADARGPGGSRTEIAARNEFDAAPLHAG